MESVLRAASGLPLASESVSRSGLALGSAKLHCRVLALETDSGPHHQPDLFRQLYQASGPVWLYQVSVRESRRLINLQR